MIVLWLVACVSTERIAEEHDAAAFAAGDALGAAVIAAELLSHADDAPDDDETLRHSGVCGCPCTSRVGATDSYVQELDYQQPSCIPWSGLLPADIGGHVWLDVDRGAVGLSRSEASVGGADLELGLDGTWQGTPTAWSATVSGAVRAGSLDTQLDGLTLTREGNGLSLQGRAAGGSLEGVVWSDAPAASRCPTPQQGSFVTDEATVSFEGGDIVVEWRGHEASYTACEIAPGVF